MHLLRVRLGFERVHEGLGAPFAQLIPSDLEKAVLVGFTADRVDLHLRFPVADHLNAIHTRSRPRQPVA